MQKTYHNTKFPFETKTKRGTKAVLLAWVSDQFIGYLSYGPCTARACGWGDDGAFGVGGGELFDGMRLTILPPHDAEGDE